MRLALRRRARHARLLVRLLPRLTESRAHRAFLADAFRFSRSLPRRLEAPLPEVLATLDLGSDPAPELEEREAPDLSDLAALLDRRSPIGLCLRRSLVRYRALRRRGLPVIIRFGARHADGTGPVRSGVAGHAWLTLDGSPYFEPDDEWRKFVVMFSHPSS